MLLRFFWHCQSVGHLISIFSCFFVGIAIEYLKMSTFPVLIPTKKRGRRSWLDIPGNAERLALMFQSMTAEEIGRSIGYSSRSVERMIARLRAQPSPEPTPISEQALDQSGHQNLEHGRSLAGEREA